MRPLRSTLALALLTPAVLITSASLGHVPAGQVAVTSVASAATADAGAPHGAATSRAVEGARFPTTRTSGVPRGWTPKRIVDGDLTVDRPGAVVEDVRVNGDLVVAASGVTLRRVEVVGGQIDNWRGDTCHTGLKVVRSTIRRAPGQVTGGDDPALQHGGYTARRVAILGLPEGFRVGGSEACGPVKIVKSFAKVVAPTECGDWHGDALQGYGGGHLTLRDTTLKLVERDGCSGTAPFFYPADQDNTSVTIDGLLVSGGGYSFRLGTPGTVTGLHVEKGSFYYGPIDVQCSLVSAWSADVAKVRSGQPRPLKQQRCNSDGGY